MQEYLLPETTVVPVATSGGDDGFVSGKGVEVVYSTIGSLQSLTLTVSANIVIKGSYGIQVKRLSILICHFLYFLILGFLV